MSEVQGADGAPVGPYVFYLAWAYVMKTVSKSSCKLWLPDHSNESKMESWLDGTLTYSDIKRELVTINFNYTLDQSVPGLPVHLGPPSCNDIPLNDLYG